MSVLYHPSKANVVVDALCPLNLGSISHIDEAKQDVVKDIHSLDRLGMRLDGFPCGGFMVHHNSKLSLVVEVKSHNTLIRH